MAADPGDFARAHEVFNDALDLAENEREIFLRRACGDDEPLRRRVEELLRAHDRPLVWLDEPQAGGWIGDSEADAASSGRRIGPYRLVRELGSGGMGVVWEAEQTEPVTRRVALKLIRPGMDTREVVRRFELERRTVFSLEHPHIARAYDAGVSEQGHPYFVMELVDGPPLTSYCEDRGLPLEERLGLFLQFCRAVQFAHVRGVVHRDLKPSNVLVAGANDPGGAAVPKVIDFGIAKILGPDAAAGEATALTLGAQPIGTPETMSPEQARGGELDVRSDVYSAGVVLYRLLAGRYPFSLAGLRSSEWQRALQVLTSALPDPPSRVLDDQATGVLSELPPNRRRELDWIVLKALAKEPERRYQSMQELAQDLERFLRREAVEAGPVTWTYRTRKLLERHRLAAAVTATIVLLVLAAAAVLGVQTVRLRAALAEAEERRLEAEQISDLMSGLFEGADVVAEGRRDVTAIELLERGERHVRETLAERPELLGRMLVRIGRSAHSLGDVDRASDLLESALEAFEATGSHLAGRAVAMRQLAQVRLDQSRQDDALSLVEASLGRARELGDPRLVVEALTTLADVQVQRAQLEPASAAIAEALALSDRATLEEIPRDVRDTALYMRSAVDMRQGRTDDALAGLLELESRAASVGAGTLAIRRAALGAALIEKGRSAEAVPLLERVLAYQIEVLGSANQRTQVTRNNLALAASNAGRLELARDMNVEGLRLERETDDGPSFSAARFLNNLGLALHGLGDLDGAEQAFREALAEQRAVVGDDHPNLAFHLSNLGRLLHERGRLDEAEQAHRRALAVREAHLDGEHPAISDTVIWLGALLLDAGRLGEALPHLERGLAIREAKLEPGNWRTAEARSWLGAARVQQGRVDEGLEMLAAAYEAIRAQRGDHWQRTPQALRRLIAGLEQTGRDEEASSYRRLLADRHP
ncbi:MAG: hypothetical protein DWQ30_00195 [Acidobacteria bacterium]|nr:MAG: hypothetical protein DWQ30_00195 [Acidobacteriota bacterium]